MILGQLAVWFATLGVAVTVAAIAVAWHWRMLYRRISNLDAARKQSEHTAETAHQLAERAAQDRSELQVQTRVAEAQRRRLEGILNAFNDAVLVTDTFNEITLANDAAVRLLEITDEAVRTRTIDEVVDDQQLIKFIKDTREGGRSLRKHIEHHMHVNGRDGIYDVALSVLSETPDTSAAGVVTILRDVTRQKEIETTKSEFVSNVSHELRTPLASIQAYLEMLIDGEAGDAASRSDFYQIMQSEADRLSRLIENMLNLSRIEAGLSTIHREPIVLPKLIQDAIDVLRPQAADKQIELIALPSPITCRLVADSDMILQVLMNLIGNAIKYTPAGGRVTVTNREDVASGIASVSVEDSGMGIPEADMPRLFDKFFRVKANAGAARGTGLGLSLVRRVVEDVHHGRIDVKSEVGRGSTFTFTLPIAEKSIGGVE